ncbi:hypothetical protein KUCAC02_027219 [Chaenocephalus aceratus]|uniref:Uncharacterized protein n=1 Tax=Chaenocephalus aceratus TaxID=36190 RepID=A0ACB9W4W4_CHAAC|nr:hypothetical protein KUCAC02_027219 [Chaenocephalus aceratus]
MEKVSRGDKTKSSTTDVYYYLLGNEKMDLQVVSQAESHQNLGPRHLFWKQNPLSCSGDFVVTMLKRHILIDPTQPSTSK